MSEPNNLNYGAIVDCIDGKHGAPGVNGRCIYCDEPLNLPDQPSATFDIIEIPTPEVVHDDALMMLRAQKVPAIEAATTTIEYVDGPLAGQIAAGVPVDATIIKDYAIVLNDEPYVGTFFDPYTTIMAYYRVNGRRAHIIWQH